MMYRFGPLHVASNFSLPLVEDSEGQADIVVQGQKDPGILYTSNPSIPVISLSKGKLSLNNIHHGRVQSSVINDSYLSVAYAPEEETAAARMVASELLTAAYVLRKRPVLHGSAVLFGGKAIIFIGKSGAGKSTTAAFLSKHTYMRLIADDCVPIYADGRTWYAVSNACHARLAHDSAQTLGVSSESFSPDGTKILYNPPNAFSRCGESFPLSAVMILSEGLEYSLVPSTFDEAFLGILGSLWFPKLQQQALGQLHLEYIRQLIEHIAVYTLTITRNFDLLHQLEPLIAQTPL